ncbi:hypothetical protein B0H11DRAFT_2106454 [Mycena galericulata]|nr:hypothetical protein B0H11DRAFT_2106454 [Mycena galericulata]
MFVRVSLQLFGVSVCAISSAGHCDASSQSGNMRLSHTPPQALIFIGVGAPFDLETRRFLDSPLSRASLFYCAPKCLRRLRTLHGNEYQSWLAISKK